MQLCCTMYNARSLNSKVTLTAASWFHDLVRHFPEFVLFVRGESCTSAPVKHMILHDAGCFIVYCLHLTAIDATDTLDHMHRQSTQMRKEGTTFIPDRDAPRTQQHIATGAVPTTVACPLRSTGCPPKLKGW